MLYVEPLSTRKKNKPTVMFMILLVVIASLVVNVAYVSFFIFQPHNKKRKLEMELEAAAFVGELLYQSLVYAVYNISYPLQVGK